MLIDWLTLRTKISDIQEADLLQLMPYMGEMRVTNMQDELIRHKLVIDIDAVRSDFIGMVWSLSSNGKDKYLNIGASPASLKHNSNLFGSDDYQECKKILIQHAKKTLPTVLLFNGDWQPRRIDITQNFYQESHYQVKDALFQLRQMDGVRQKATVMNGDTVYWGASSHYRTGKAYDKYVQALQLNKKALKLKKPPIYTNEQLELMQTILRLELKLGRQYFDEHQDESLFTTEFLTNEHNAFFDKFIGSAEVTDMDKLLSNLILTAPSEGRAKAAYTTYLFIKQNGYEYTKEHTPVSTFRRHRKYLKDAGLSESDLTSAQIIPLRKRRITLEPVNSWAELEHLNRKAA